MPMKYFESRTVGEVLSRITNDVDTLGQSLNQSVTILITSVTTIIGVLIMMLTISPLMTLIAFQSGHQTLTEVFLYPAGIPWKDQRTG